MEDLTTVHIELNLDYSKILNTVCRQIVLFCYNFLINDNYPLITLCNSVGFLSLFFESNYHFIRSIKGHNNVIL